MQAYIPHKQWFINNQNFSEVKEIAYINRQHMFVWPQSVSRCNHSYCPLILKPSLCLCAIVIDATYSYGPTKRGFLLLVVVLYRLCFITVVSIYRWCFRWLIYDRFTSFFVSTFFFHKDSTTDPIHSVQLQTARDQRNVVIYITDSRFRWSLSKRWSFSDGD